MLLGNAFKLVIQAIYFVLIARFLGPQQYGSFVAVVATVAIVSPFIGNGYSNLMIQHVARDRTVYAKALGNLIILTVVSELILFVALTPLCLHIFALAISPTSLIMIFIADLIFAPLTAVTGFAFQSMERLEWTAMVDVLISSMRLVGIVAVILLHSQTLLTWSVTYLICTTISCIVASVCLLRCLGLPHFELHDVHRELWQGFHFSVGLSAQSLYNDIDKTMLAKLSTLDAVGVYAVSYRIIDVAFLPIRSVLSAAYPTFFQSGKDGIISSSRHGLSLLKVTVPYSLFAFAGLTIVAPLIPLILGNQYTQAADALRWLAVLPLLKTLHYFVADALTGAGYQGLRTLVQLGIAGFNVIINLALLPRYGWRGAAWASIASDGLLALLLWIMAYILVKAEHLRVGIAAVDSID